MLGPLDDLVLQLDRAIQEIFAVAGHPDDQVAVLLGVLLSIALGVGGDHVELDVVPRHLEVGPDQMAEVVDAFLVLQKQGG